MPRAKLFDAKPKGRMTAYAFFVQSCRGEHKLKYPDENVIFAEFSRKCAERWKIMEEKEKQPFFELADRDKNRYDSEMSEYQGPGTARSGRRRRQRKDPNAPKRALSAFFWFAQDERPSVRAIYPNVGIGDISKELAARWNSIDPLKKVKYEELANRDKARYAEQMKEFRSNPLASFRSSSTKQSPIESQQQVQHQGLQQQQIQHQESHQQQAPIQQSQLPQTQQHQPQQSQTNQQQTQDQQQNLMNFNAAMNQNYASNSSYQQNYSPGANFAAALASQNYMAYQNYAAAAANSNYMANNYAAAMMSQSQTDSYQNCKEENESDDGETNE